MFVNASGSMAADVADVAGGKRAMRLLVWFSAGDEYDDENRNHQWLTTVVDGPVSGGDQEVERFSRIEWCVCVVKRARQAGLETLKWMKEVENGTV